ncbi:methylenetetrahydrofolate reductase [NAD(P)H] [Maritimibacter sp. 55A14]|uniref:methylenetetrahydrofolate reductase [NAD(P)H] n=1 Tax=Maritimibacter sp. 55A14 TaxID=2174844 RepID=UPI000D60E751|nr:methylenetetrahydrofolate reductase [NAD(P)H] [Maritimibacter sp. 55A14]PWE32016.1 methylenetetrahydrofolate reductase [NAD(P)H] [Maritimibacter sp. 55A14]
MTPNVSFEFFPPKTLDASFRLWDAVQTLAPLNPAFVSVTYGAGGTTRKLTHEAVEAIHGNTGLNVAAHLTCVDATREETLEIARGYARLGVSDLVALRGDPPKGQGRFRAAPDGFASSVELIEGLKEAGDFTIRVGAYPDPHPDAADVDADVSWLKRKFEAGADYAITQFFFEAENFFRFRDRAEKAGIDGARLIPGVLPVEDWAKASRFAAACGAHVPREIDTAFRRAVRDGREELMAIAVCSELCADLVEGGAENLHFYTLNKPHLTREVCGALGISPKVELSQVA